MSRSGANFPSKFDQNQYDRPRSGSSAPARGAGEARRGSKRMSVTTTAKIVPANPLGGTAA